MRSDVIDLPGMHALERFFRAILSINPLGLTANPSNFIMVDSFSGETFGQSNCRALVGN